MRDLDSNRVLTNAKQLTRELYRLTGTLPDSERYGLTSQIRRASVSVAANIAEGLGNGSPGQFERYLRIAAGSAAELEVLIELAGDLHDMQSEKVTDRIDHIRRQLILLIRSVHAKRSTD